LGKGNEVEDRVKSDNESVGESPNDRKNRGDVREKRFVFIKTGERLVDKKVGDS